MNERTHSWDPPLDIAEKLLNLDKDDRRKLFTELKGWPCWHHCAAT